MKKYSKKRTPSIKKSRLKGKKQIVEKDRWRMWHLAKRLQPKERRS